MQQMEFAQAKRFAHARMRSPMAVGFDHARDRGGRHRVERTDQKIDAYLNTILLPGIQHPRDRESLFATDTARLAAENAVVATGSASGRLIAGLYITVDDDTVWVRGVRVLHPFRGLGYGSQIVHAACRFARTQLGVKRAALTVRCDDAGHPYDAVHTYERCGFRMVHVFPVTVSGSSYDRHHGPAGSSFLSARMEAVL